MALKHKPKLICVSSTSFAKTKKVCLRCVFCCPMFCLYCLLSKCQTENVSSSFWSSTLTNKHSYFQPLYNITKQGWCCCCLLKKHKFLNFVIKITGFDAVAVNKCLENLNGPFSTSSGRTFYFWSSSPYSYLSPVSLMKRSSTNQLCHCNISVHVMYNCHSYFCLFLNVIPNQKVFESTHGKRSLGWTQKSLLSNPTGHSSKH